VHGEYELEAFGEASGRLSVEINLAMPSSAGPGGSYIYEGAMIGNFGSAHAWGSAWALTLADAALGGHVELAVDPPSDLRAAPLFTVSQSEAGFEKIMQAVTLTLSWPLSLTAGDVHHFDIKLTSIKAKASGRARSDAPAAAKTDMPAS
jgi:hypothetical protein